MRISPLLLAPVVLLVLAGCTTSPVSTSSSSSAAAGPPAFPRVAGAVESRARPVPAEWRLTIRVDDSEAAYREARHLLVGGGFTLTKDREGTGGGDGQACTRDLCVGFTATDIPGAGPTVVYDVFHPTGIVG